MNCNNKDNTKWRLMSDPRSFLQDRHKQHLCLDQVRKTSKNKQAGWRHSETSTSKRAGDTGNKQASGLETPVKLGTDWCELVSWGFGTVLTNSRSKVAEAAMQMKQMINKTNIFSAAHYYPWVLFQSEISMPQPEFLVRNIFIFWTYLRYAV